MATDTRVINSDSSSEDQRLLTDDDLIDGTRVITDTGVINSDSSSEDQRLLIDEDLINGTRVILPADRYHLVYIVFYLLGVAALLPWNFFINAKQYFMYKLRNTSHSLGNDSMSWTNESLFNQNQIMFENYLELAALLPSVVFMFVNMAATKIVTVKVRVSGAMVVVIALFALTILLTSINTDRWQNEFLVLSLVSVVLMNAGSSVLQGALCGLASMFPRKYMQAVMSGMDFVKFYLSEPSASKERERRDSISSELEEAESRLTPPTVQVKISSAHICHLLISVFKLIWLEGLCILTIFLVSLSCYPALTSAIQSTTLHNTAAKPSIWAELYFVPVACFLVFNVADFIGRCTGGCIQWSTSQTSRGLLLSLSTLRILFIPLLMFSNVQPRSHLPVLFHHDSVPFITMALFGLSNGYLATVAMTNGPKHVKEADSEIAGSMMGFCMSVGLGLGAVLSVFFRHSV